MNNSLKSIAVFCGSSTGNNPTIPKAAEQLGEEMAQNEIQLIYGGGKVGLMGIIADSVMNNGGKAIGIIPNFLNDKEIGHTGLTKLICVESMHERKKMMHDMSDGIIALPGGYGTLEELFEMITWAQLGLHQKPIGILNTDGFYDYLISFISNISATGLLKEIHRDMLIIEDCPRKLLDKMQQYRAPIVPKWLKKKGV